MERPNDLYMTATIHPWLAPEARFKVKVAPDKTAFVITLGDLTMFCSREQIAALVNDFAPYVPAAAAAPDDLDRADRALEQGV